MAVQDVSLLQEQERRRKAERAAHSALNGPRVMAYEYSGPDFQVCGQMCLFLFPRELRGKRWLEILHTLSLSPLLLSSPSLPPSPSLPFPNPYH